MTTSEPVERLRALAFDALGRVDLPERTRAVFAGSPQPSSIVAIGKSAGPMLDGALRARQSPCPTLAVVPDGAPAPDTPSVELLRAAHPYPDGRVDHIAARLTALVTASTAEQPVWLCLSGGGSACLSWPRPPLTVAGLADVTRALMLRGATIEALNTVRKALCPLLGGGLGALAGGLIAAVAVDIPHEDLSIVASGPAVPDAAPSGAALQVLKAFDLVDTHPAAAECAAQHVPPVCPPWPHHVVAAPSVLRDVLAALAPDARVVREAPTTLIDIDRLLVAPALRDGGLHAAVGEVTAPVPDNAPPGGRCTHLALHVAEALRGRVPSFAVLAMGSDGRDGPTGSAGALCTAQTLASFSADEGRAALQQGAARPLLERAGALIPRFSSPVNLLDMVLLWLPTSGMAEGTGDG